MLAYHYTLISSWFSMLEQGIRVYYYDTMDPTDHTDPLGCKDSAFADPNHGLLVHIYNAILSR